MTDSTTSLANWIRSEFAVEEQSDFHRLRRIPDTRVIRFLDYFASLDVDARAEFSEIRIDWSSRRLSGQMLPTHTVERFARATEFPDQKGGLRYSGTNLLGGLAKDSIPGGLTEWFRERGASELALDPPRTLAPEIANLVPVKIPTLRRMVNAVFSRLFAPKVTNIGSETWRYAGDLHGSTLIIHIRYSGRMSNPQLRYSVTLQVKGRAIVAPDFGFESIFGAGYGCWDYLTRENAERSVNLLGELLGYIAKLPDRLPEGYCLESRNHPDLQGYL